MEGLGKGRRRFATKRGSLRVPPGIVILPVPSVL